MTPWQPELPREGQALECLLRVPPNPLAAPPPLGHRKGKASQPPPALDARSVELTVPSMFEQY